jgi:predicted phosphodiesterase
MKEIFPDKKIRLEGTELFDQVSDLLVRSRELEGRFEIGQKEATWIPEPEYPQLPMMLMLMTDTHFGSNKVDTHLLREHLNILKNTPNFFMVHNGDNVDNFNATGKWASGMMEDPVHPQTTSRAWCEVMGVLDNHAKIGAMSFGNHDDFGYKAGQDWYESFLSGMTCPIFTSGGLLHIVYGGYKYDLAMTHMYWGTSKLNPTNATKRFIEHEYPEADIAFLGHTHQSEGLHFERGGKDRIGVIGGTYKDKDVYARKWGIGGRSGSPGWVVALWPGQRQMHLFKDVTLAQEFLYTQIHQLTMDEEWVDPYTNGKRNNHSS